MSMTSTSAVLGTFQQQADSSPIRRLRRRLTDSCSFSRYSQRSQQVSPHPPTPHSQRQLGMAGSKGNVTTYLVADRHSPGVPHDANTSACSTKAVNPTRCTAESRREGHTWTWPGVWGGDSQPRKGRKDLHPFHSISHSNWESGTGDPVPGLRMLPAASSCPACRVLEGSKPNARSVSSTLLSKHTPEDTLFRCPAAEMKSHYH